MPWRLAFALQDDGWWLRQDIIWSKNNPMPESVQDRCTKSHEYLFLLAKSEIYYYDNEAIKEDSDPSAGRDTTCARRDPPPGRVPDSGFINGRRFLKRNKRSVWTISTQPFPEAHFATFPKLLVEPCILAGTSEKGCCEECGTPWERLMTEPTGGMKGTGYHDHSDDLANGARSNHGAAVFKSYVPGVTIGWQQACDCNAGAVACTVLDPFMGSGTTGIVALENRCNFIGIELNPEYAAMAERRLAPLVAQGVLV